MGTPSLAEQPIPSLVCPDMQLSRLLGAINHPYMKGRGGREFNNELHHLNVAFLRQQKGLMPLFICGFGGAIFVGFYIARLATKTTDVNWFKEKDLDIVNGRYADKQFKFLNPDGHDYTGFADARPLYKSSK